MKPSFTSTVITICSKSHSDVWKLTSALLPHHVKADRYIVYVPESEIEHFEVITNGGIEVASQEELGVDFTKQLKLQFEGKANFMRFGWYLQQFYKIEALRRSQSEIVAIWDADCVPVSGIELFDNQGRPVYVNSSKEYHNDYFDNINRLLGMKRIQSHSFVIPGFPIKKCWVDEFIEFIETKHQLPWYQAIIESTDFSLGSGFSETETMGTWIANTYPSEWTTRFGTWERFGQSRFGYAKRFTPKRLIKLGAKKDLEIISFENWDVRGHKRLLRTLRRFFDWYRS
jgi:hypothetical protein